MANITCSGPGPHIPASGILGTTDRTQAADVRCAAVACVQPVPVEVTNRQSIETKAINALNTNVTYLALAAPTTAQNTAQVQALTRQASALIRLALNQLTSTSGT